jgi:hypothetical protein
MGIEIHPSINSVNPLNWLVMVIVYRGSSRPGCGQILVALYGTALGTILRRIRRMVKQKLLITDNVLPHEKRPGDKSLQNIFLRVATPLLP